MTQLNPQQKAAVETESGKALVLGSPGGGKTRVLTERISHLIENKKVSPSEILSFTFTRKSAGEMRKRLEDRIGSQAHSVTMGTMHKTALVMIQRFGEMIGLKPGKITVYSQWEENYLLKDVALELGYHNGKNYKGIKKEDIKGLFNGYYQRGIYPHKYAPGFDLFSVFNQRCRENNALTYGSLLTGFKALIPKISNLLHFKYIFVDEVQDLDPLQWMLVNLLCDEFGAALFVVGDIDQSIYQFRGAAPEYLIRHEKEFDIYRLETNYRSGIAIVEAANKLISHNKDRLDKTMVAHQVYDQAVYTCYDMDSTKIAAGLGLLGCETSIIQKGHKLKDIAIIGRNHFLLESLSEKLTAAGIKNNYAGKKTALTNSEEFRRFHAFLKLIVNPYDNFSFLLIRELIGIDRMEYAEIREKAVIEGKSHFQAWDSEKSKNGKGFFDSCDQWEFMDLILNTASLWDPGLSQWLGDEPYNGPESMQEIIEFARSWYVSESNINGSACTEGPVKNYLEWLATYDVPDEITENEDCIQLMTIHAAKGLEWPVVIVAGCNDGILPGKRAFKSVDEMESETRLMYVAITRAEHQLILTSRPTHSSDGELISPISRFISWAI